jgi:N utilization substance protein A
VTTLNINVKIDPVGGDIRAYRQMVVVEEVEEPNVEMTMSDAMKWKPDVRIGDVLDFEEQLPPNAGRIAAQTAKQVVLQRLREAERDAVYDEYIGKEGELLVGTVQRVEARQMIVELGRGTEAVLPFPEQVRNEHLRPGQRVKVLVLEVLKAVKGPQIVGPPNMLRRLWMEVGIKRHRRDRSSRVRPGPLESRGACPQQNDPSARVGRAALDQNIVNELAGEQPRDHGIHPVNSFEHSARPRCSNAKSRTSNRRRCPDRALAGYWQRRPECASQRN